jgi:hypothetical protein
MIELIRSSAVPANLMQAAARGALAVPAAEMIEILVHLANHNKVFGQLARMTLAGWDEKSCLEAAADPKTPQEVLDYWTAIENLRPKLLPALLENTTVSETTLTVMAATGSRDVVDAMKQSPRVQTLPNVLRALASNPNSTRSESEKLTKHVEASDAGGASASANDGSPETDEENEAVTAYLSQYATEIAAEADKPFQPLGGMRELEPAASAGGEAVAEIAPAEQPAAVVSSPAAAGKATAAAPAKSASPAKKPHAVGEQERGSSLQKISKLDIKGRIQLAMKGNKEERSILVRDSTKLVALAVLESGKITDGEVEKFASQKNVLEAVLRQIPMKRRFVKNYNVVRNLVANPRTPLDISLGLMKNLLVADLRNLSANKDVPDTIRKLALKMFKQKTDTTKKS